MEWEEVQLPLRYNGLVLKKGQLLSDNIGKDVLGNDLYISVEGGAQTTPLFNGKKELKPTAATSSQVDILAEINKSLKANLNTIQFQHCEIKEKFLDLPPFINSSRESKLFGCCSFEPLTSVR